MRYLIITVSRNSTQAFDVSVMPLEDGLHAIFVYFESGNRTQFWMCVACCVEVLFELGSLVLGEVEEGVWREVAVLQHEVEYVSCVVNEGSV